MSEPIQARVEHNDMVVVIRTTVSTDEIPLYPETALVFAEALARGAYNIRYGMSRDLVGADNMRSALTEIQRKKSIARVVIVLTNMRDSTKGPEYWAAQIVDSIFSQIS